MVISDDNNDYNDSFDFLYESYISATGLTVLLVLVITLIFGVIIRLWYKRRDSKFVELPFDFATATRYMTIDHLFTDELMKKEEVQLIDLMYHTHRITLKGNNSHSFPWHLPLVPAQEIEYLVDHDQFKKFAQKVNQIAEWKKREILILHLLFFLYYPFHWYYLRKLKKDKFFGIQRYFQSIEFEFNQALDNYNIRVKLSKSADSTILYLDVFNYKWSDLQYFLLSCPYVIQLSGEGNFIRPLYLCESNPFLTCLYFSINRNIDKEEMDEERGKILENLVNHKCRMENSQQFNKFIIKFNRLARAIDLESADITADVTNLLLFIKQQNQQFFSQFFIRIDLFISLNNEYTILDNHESPDFKRFLQLVKNKNIKFCIFIFDTETDLDDIDDVLENQRISFDENMFKQQLVVSEGVPCEFSMEDLKEKFIEKEQQQEYQSYQRQSKSQVSDSFYQEEEEVEQEKTKFSVSVGYIRTMLLSHKKPIFMRDKHLGIQIAGVLIEALLLPVIFAIDVKYLGQSFKDFTQIQLFLLPYAFSLPLCCILGCLWISTQSYGIAKLHAIYNVLSIFNLSIYILQLLIENQYLEAIISIIDFLVKLALIWNSKRVLCLNIELNKLNQSKHIGY